MALSGSILAANLHGSLQAGFVPASHAAWLLLAGCGAAIMVLGLAANSRWAAGTAARTAAAYENADAKAPAMSA